MLDGAISSKMDSLSTVGDAARMINRRPCFMTAYGTFPTKRNEIDGYGMGRVSYTF